jgi:hypothetical protein
MAGKRASSKPDSHRVFGQGPGPRKTPCRAGLYARVSTHDQQTLPFGPREIREYLGHLAQTKFLAPPEPEIS